jgi:hypothetical protein
MARIKAEHNDKVVEELQRLRSEIERLRSESAKDRFWTHLGVEGTLIALSVALLTYPHPLNSSLFGSLSTLEGGVLLLASSVSLLVTISRRGLRDTRSTRH